MFLKKNKTVKNMIENLSRGPATIIPNRVEEPMDKPSLTNRPDKPVTPKQPGGCNHTYILIPGSYKKGKTGFQLTAYCMHCMDVQVKHHDH